MFVSLPPTGPAFRPTTPPDVPPAARARQQLLFAAWKPNPLTLEVERLSPPSRTMDLLMPSGRTIHLRRWWQPGQTEPPYRQPGPVIFLVHGLSGCSAWMAPMVEEFLKRPENRNVQIYGIDLPGIGQHPYPEGNIESLSELVDSVREGINFVSERHGGPVYGVGLSLGGFLLSNVAADNPPETLKGIALLSPAFKPHPERASRQAYQRTLSNLVRRKLAGQKSEGVPFLPPQPAAPSSPRFSPLQKAILREKEAAPDRPKTMTFMSYIKMFAGMYHFRNSLAPRLSLPVKVYATDTDDLVDVQVLQETVARFPARNKELKLYPKAAHDLVLDPLNSRISEEISQFFAELAQ